MNIFDFIIGIVVGIACIVLYNNFFRRENLKKEFKKISNEILVEQADAIAKKATDTVETTNKAIIDPLKDKLKEMKEYVEGVEKERKEDKGSLETEIKNLNTVHDKLSESTSDLKSALKGNTTTGKWGNQKLKNIVEMAGMTEHVDFDIEVDADVLDEDGKRRRADAVIKLADGGKIAIDAKTSLTAFLQIHNEKDPEKKEELIKQHTNNVHNHIKDLYKERKYHTLFDNSVPFTIMFVPHEPALNTAFNQNPVLFDEAFKNNIVVTSSSSLYSLLQVIAQGWAQVTIDDNQTKIMELAEGLYNSTAIFTEKYFDLGKSIKNTIRDYNASIGSFDKTFTNSRKKLIEYGVDKAKVKPIENDVEELEAPDIKEPKNFRN